MIALPGGVERGRNCSVGLGHGHTGIERLRLLISRAGSGEVDVRNRYLTIAQHYRTLAEAEERNATRHATERRLRRDGN